MDAPDLANYLLTWFFQKELLIWFQFPHKAASSMLLDIFEKFGGTLISQERSREVACAKCELLLILVMVPSDHKHYPI